MVNLDNGLFVTSGGATALPDSIASAKRQMNYLGVPHQVVVYAGNSSEVYAWLAFGRNKGEPEPQVVWSSLEDSEQTMEELLNADRTGLPGYLDQRDHERVTGR
jgi:hypothetical protein